MRPKQLDRTLNLVRRTGDTAVIMDRSTDDVYVLMDLDKYEGLLDQTDLPPAPPKGDNPADSVLDDYVLDDVIDAVEKANAPTATEDVIVPTAQKEEVHLGFEENWTSAPSQKTAEISEKEAEPTVVPLVTPGEETNLGDVPNDGEEQTFYLEPVE